MTASDGRRASVDSLLFAVQIADWRAVDVLERRIRALTTFYAPLGTPVLETIATPALRLLAGQIHFDGASGDGRSPLVWGGPLPGELWSRGLVEADDTALRALEGVVAAFAVEQNRGVLVSGSGGIATLYHASGELGRAYATQAVAAAWLARGQVTVDPAVIPELLALDYVGDDRTLVTGSRALGTSARITFTPAGASTGTYWPARERWELVPEAVAQETAERELIGSLARRAAPLAAPFVALTAGLDSRTVAVALAQADVGFETFTWGRSVSDDVAGARRVAKALGVDHHVQAFEWRDDETAMRLVDAEARWTEGATAVRFIAETYPSRLSGVINGIGGEIGRAFYYNAALARAKPEPSLDELTRLFGRERPAHLPKERVAALRARQRAWLEDADSLGLRGWRCLDVVYAEQRVRRWGRAMLPRLGAAVSPGFATPRVARALMSLPLEERLTDGLPRRFLASRVPSLAPAVGGRARPPRGIGVRIPGARALRRMVRRQPDRDRWFASASWETRPRLRSWIADESLAAPLLTDAMGDRWLAHTRAGVLAGHARETRQALLVAAPVALEHALRDLVEK